MRIALRFGVCGAAALFSTLFLAAPSRADEASWLAGDMVRVAQHRTDLTPLPREGSRPLMGYLARPDELGRHPAVIELHGCGGFGAMDVVAADVLKSFGYVASRSTASAIATSAAGTTPTLHWPRLLTPMRRSTG